MSPRGHHGKFKDVPQNPADPNETLVTITRFMKNRHDREQKTGTRISDGKYTKMNKPEDKKQTKIKSSKKPKAKKGNGNKDKNKVDPAICRCWGCKRPSSQVG